MIVLMAKYAILNSKWRSPKMVPSNHPSSFGYPHLWTTLNNIDY